MEKLNELEQDIIHFGSFICSYCDQGKCEHCAGHNNMDLCLCSIVQHDRAEVIKVGLKQGMSRLKAMRQV